MSKTKVTSGSKRRWTREFKLAAVMRMNAAASIKALAEELGVRSKRRPFRRHRRWPAPNSGGSKNWNGRSASSSWTWIFFAQPCGMSGSNA